MKFFTKISDLMLSGFAPKSAARAACSPMEDYVCTVDIQCAGARSFYHRQRWTDCTVKWTWLACCA